MNKVAVLYGKSISAMIDRGEDPAVLSHYDELVVSESVLDQIRGQLDPRLADDLVAKAFLYFDPWSKDTFTNAARPYDCWQPGPGDVGEPDVVFGKTHAYQFPISHTDRFTMWVGTALLRSHQAAAGAFLDDFYHDRRHWQPKGNTHEGALLRDQVWLWRDGYPSWRDNGEVEWNSRKMASILAGCVAFAGLRRKRIIINSNAKFRTHQAARVFFEGVGPYEGAAPWGATYWDTLPEVITTGKAGDLIWVRCLDADGAMIPDMEKTWALALEVAVDMGMSIGRTFAVWPNNGAGTTCSNTEDPLLWQVP